MTQINGTMVDFNGVATSTTLTDTQRKHIYDKLESMNTSKEKLEKAQAMTVATSGYLEVDESSFEPMEEQPEEAVEDIVNRSSNDTLKQVFKESGLDFTEDEANGLIALIMEYNKDKSTKCYDRLPKVLKDEADNLYMAHAKQKAYGKRINISRETIAKFFIDSFISDTAFQQVLNEVNDEMSTAAVEMNKELADIFNDAYNEVFDKIDEIRAEDPEKADRIESIKNAFNDAATMNPMLEYLNNDKPRNVRKYHRHYASDPARFNKLVNVTDIKVPDITQLYDIIKLRLPTYSSDDIKAFIVLLARHAMDLDFTEVKNIAYVYRLVDSIYKYKFITAAYEDEHSKAVMDRVSHIMDEINQYKEIRGGKDNAGTLSS